VEDGEGVATVSCSCQYARLPSRRCPRQPLGRGGGCGSGDAAAARVRLLTGSGSTRGGGSVCGGGE
jgi:hypothetical protein